MAEKPKTSLRVIVARVMVGVLFSMLIVSFAIWGIGPIFREGGRYKPLAEVGDVRITPQQYQEQYRREVDRLQRALQTSLDTQRARELGIPQRVLQQMIGRALFDLAAKDAGVEVSDQVIRASIMENPNFRDSKGAFDRNLFENLLYNAGYSEDQFVALARQDLARAQVTDAVTAGVSVPKTLTDILYGYRYERRVAETLTVSADTITNVPTPTDAELDTFRKDHAEAYTAPEYRTITAVLLRPQDIVSRFKVADDKVKNEYDQRIAEFRVPEQRDIRQIVLPDQAAAKKAEDMLAKGQSFDQVATALTGKAPSDLGMLKPGDLGNEQMNAAAFALKEGGASQPIQDPLGWHIVQAAKIVPGHTRPFDEVKDKLAHDLALRAAGDAVFDMGNQLQDALGGGASLEEAAKKLSLKIIKIDAVDAKGIAPDGKPVADLPDAGKFLQTAFAADTGRESDLIDDGHGGFFILRVDKVTPSGLQPLAAVHDKVMADWQADARAKAAGKIAADLLAKAKGGAKLADLARAGSYPVATTPPFLRTGEGANAPLPPALIASLFTAKVGDVVMATAPDGAVIGRLVSIQPADQKTDQATVAKLHDQILGALGADTLNDFAEALRKEYGVEVNEGLVNSLIGS